MRGETSQYTEQIRCPYCGSDFRVELRKMRFDLPSVCPACDNQCRISRDQAIRAQRLLERLEYRDRAAGTPCLPAIGAAKTDMALY